MITKPVTHHEFYMQRCIELALIAKARGESPVGSLIVLNDNIIAEGIEAVKAFNDITYHSEIEAIRKATAFLQLTNLAHCSLYTTHEPCIMCSYAIRHHQIKQVVFGLATGQIGGYHSALPVLLDTTIKKWGAPPEIIGGILGDECKRLHDCV